MKNNEPNTAIKDTLFVSVEDKFPQYKSVFITSIRSDMKTTFNSGDFVKDFNDAIAEGSRIMFLGRFERMYLTSSCDDFLMDSDGMYSYVYSTENPDDSNLIGVKKV